MVGQGGVKAPTHDHHVLSQEQLVVGGSYSGSGNLGGYFEYFCWISRESGGWGEFRGGVWGWGTSSLIPIPPVELAGGRALLSENTAQGHGHKSMTLARGFADVGVRCFFARILEPKL